MSEFPFYHQHDSMQCGITCLQMVCKYYGKEYSPDTFSRYCFATTERGSLLGISETATRLGLHTICGRVTIAQLHEAHLKVLQSFRTDGVKFRYIVRCTGLQISNRGNDYRILILK